MPRTLGVGMVGWGFIGKVHTYGYINLPLFYRTCPASINLIGVCTAGEKTARLAKKNRGFFLWHYFLPGYFRERRY